MSIDSTQLYTTTCQSCGVEGAAPYSMPNKPIQVLCANCSAAQLTTMTVTGNPQQGPLT